MKSNYFLYFILFCGILLFAQPVKSADLSLQEAESFALEQGNNLLSFFAEKDIATKYQKLDNMFLNYVDLDYIGKFVIGRYWRQMTPEQREKYMGLFKRYSINVYKGFPLTFENRLSFDITSSRSEKKDVFVTADIKYQQNPQSEPMQFVVEFRMHKVNDTIKITDIKIAESSLILSYRNKFYEMVKASDEEIEWFLEDFELLTVSAEKQYAL
ncbi:MAG: ABC transporter substrate-binding protein [Alphaproteobacteria bacterium]|nr:ABC transporter substrate-binding protein [Alphaproteobacteria bacterium]